jgi:hypothetical protein
MQYHAGSVKLAHREPGGAHADSRLLSPIWFVRRRRLFRSRSLWQVAGGHARRRFDCRHGWLRWEFVVDRLVRWVILSMGTTPQPPLVKTQLTRLKPDLERHFGAALVDCQETQFLHYVTGDHGDRNERPDASRISKKNSPELGSDLPQRGLCRAGRGHLRWWWCRPVGQLLIGFPADLWQGVAPATHGDRDTITGRKPLRGRTAENAGVRIQQQHFLLAQHNYGSEAR